MSRKMPIVFLLMVGVLLIYGLVSYHLQKKVFVDNYAEIVLIRERNVDGYLHLSRSFGSAGMWTELYERLEDARQKHFLDFFILQKVSESGARKVEWYGSPDGNADALDIDYKRFDQPVFNKESTYETFQIGDHRLTLGILKKFDLYLKVQMDLLRADIVKEAIYFALIVFFVALYVFRDFFKILRNVRKGHVKDLAKMKGNSSESDEMLRGLLGFNEQVEGLQSENALYKRQVLPSLKKEIFSGKKPPYDFECTLVRTDINNFSTIYNTHDVESFMRVINEFFVEVTHLVSRYKGLVHEFVGDEVIFYFKDEDHTNSFMIALSSVRDIGAVAEKFNARTLKEFGYPFTVKSSLAHGKVRFGPLVNGFGVAGSVLIETVRILSHVIEKDGNVIYFDKAHAARIQKYARVEEATRVKLKGFSDEKTLVRYTNHESLAHLLSHLDLTTVSNLSFYRSDNDLVRTLNYLRAHTESSSERLLLQAIQVLKGFVVTKTDERITSTLRNWIQELESGLGNDPNGKYAKALSALVASLPSLVPDQAMPKEMLSEIDALLKCADKRVVANVVETLTHFEHATRAALLRRIGGETNDRIVANTLVHDGKRELGSPVYRGLKKLLDSASPTSVASGLFALGEIAAHYKQNDPVQFSTQRPLQELIQKIARFASHEDESVVRQAEIAAKKCGNPEVLSVFETTQSKRPAA
jgi:class 3 adenylate cyclase